MQRTRNGGAATPAIGGRIVDFEFALAAEAADDVDFPAHLGHRHLGAGGGHWGADDPAADALGEGRGSEEGTAGQQHAAEQCDELAPLHSITSSAVASSACGTLRPRTFAVCRLMMNSNLAARITGSSAAFSPLRMRPV